MRRFPLALALLALLGVLSVGAAILGAVQAPTGADVAVHNDATNTLAASTIEGHYTASYLGGDVISFVYTAPGKVTEVATASGGTVKDRRTATGTAALSVLRPVQDLLAISGFSGPGPDYASVRNLADLVPAQERGAVTGTYQTSVRVSHGYVVSVGLDIAATEAGEHLSEQVQYHLTRIGSWEAS